MLYGSHKLKLYPKKQLVPVLRNADQKLNSFSYMA
jgi:hypothetical protein